MRFRARTVMVAAAAAAALILAGCGGGSGPSAGGSGQAPAASGAAGASTSQGGTLTIGAILNQQTFDPAQAHLGNNIQYFQPVYDSLVLRAPDGTPEPMLATKWSYNSDKTVLTLTIRQGVTFSDGTKVDAAAVKTNLDRFINDNGPDSSTLSLVSNVSTPEPYTVEITLKAPDPSLINYLGAEDSFIASPKAIAAGHIATDPVGSGPYVYDAAASVAGSVYTFNKRTGYWDPALQHYDKIVIKPILDTTAMVNALLSGQVDAASVVPSAAARLKASGLTEYDIPVNWYGLMLFDRDGKVVPALKNVKVRQAINYAIDKEAILKQVQANKGQLDSQILPPGVPGYDKALVDAYTYNPTKAKQLLAEAGYPNGFSMSMPTASNLPPALPAAIGQYLKNVGITVNWDNISPNDYVADLVGGKFPAAWFQEGQGTAWYTATIQLTPKAVYNPFHTTDPKVETLLHDIQYESGQQLATAATQLNQYIVQQAWFAPFFQADIVYFTGKTTTVQPQALQAVPSIYYYQPKA